MTVPPSPGATLPDPMESSRSERPARSTSRRTRLVAASVATVLCLVVLELMARTFASFALVDGDLMFVTARDGERGLLEIYEIDGVPLWRREHPGRRAPQAEKQGTRIVALGDSVIMPALVSDAEGALSLTEARLRASGHPVEIVNLSEGGFATVQEEKLLGRALELGADVVLVGLVPNDTQQFVYRGGHLENVRFVDAARVRGPAWLTPLWRSSYAYNAIWLALHEIATPDMTMVPSEEDEQRLVLGPLRRMAATASGRGVRLAIVCFPNLGVERFDDSSACVFSQTAQWARQAGVPFFDAGTSYQGEDPPGMRLDLIHLSTYGHTVLAKGLTDWLVAEGLVGAPR